MFTHPSPVLSLRRKSILRQAPVLLLACVLLLITALPAAAQEPTAAPQPVASPDGFVSVLVDLAAPPAADAWLATAQAMGVDASARPLGADGVTVAADASVDALTAMAAASQAQMATVAAQQQALAAPLAALGAVEIYRAQRLYNAIAVRVPTDALAAVRTLPGVVGVRTLVPVVATMTKSLPFLGVPYVWQGAYGAQYRGDNVSVAIIDTGIDYLHRTFAGPGTGYLENDVTVINDVPGYPGVKVVGGWDFAGDEYDANSYNLTPDPDPDPMDCYGHGTHVAGTVAGYGVTLGLQTFAGPFGANVDFDQLQVGPGVAPGADLYALKVFGCSGSSEIVDTAIEWAVDPNGDGNFSDKLDIINMSLGSGFGSPLTHTALASDKASELGVLVVASAGNNDTVYYIAGSPGSATRALSVAATELPYDDGGIWAGSEADKLAYFSSLGPRRLDSFLKPEIAAPGVAISSALSGSGWDATILSGTSMAAPHVAGAAALLLQQRPTLTPEELKALLMNTAAPVVRDVDSYESERAPLERAGTGRIDIPAALRSPVFAYATSTPGLVSLSIPMPEVVDNLGNLQNLRVVNRSAQAHSYDLFYMPQNSASDRAGVTVQLGGPVTVAAGATANVPVSVTVYADQLRNHIATDDTDESAPLEAEAGLVWLWPRPSTFSASATGAKATPPNNYTATAALTANFDVATSTLAWQVAVGNTSETVHKVELRRGPVGSADFGSAYTLYERGGGPPPALPIAGSTVIDRADLHLLAGNYLQLAVTFAPSGATVMAALESGVPILKVPLYLVTRPASTMNVAQDTIDYGTGEVMFRALPLSGRPLAASGAPTATVALLTPLELHARSPRYPNTEESTVPDWADIRYVGITSDLATAASIDEATVTFGMTTWGQRDTFHQIKYRFYIDVNADDTIEYMVHNGDRSWPDAPGDVTYVTSFADQMAMTIGDLNGAERNQFVIPKYNTNTIVFTVPAAAIGLTADATTFKVIPVTDIWVSDTPTDHGDQAPDILFDALRPGIAFDAPWVLPGLMLDTPGNSLVTRLNVVFAERSTADGILLIHHHNTADARAEVVEIKYAWPYSLRFPFAAGRPLK